MKNQNRRKGFTLVELIVVLAILGVLIAILVPALTGYIDKANLRACQVNKAGLLRDLTADEIYETQGETLALARLQELAQASEYHCRQGGAYEVTRASDGTIMATCHKHDTDYNFNMSQALAHAMTNNPEVKELLERYMSQGKNIDSSSKTGKAYESVLSALKNLGFDPDLQNVKTWSFQAYGDKSYLFYWSTEDISTKKPGDTVKVMRYNAAKGTYTAGTIEVKTETLSASDSSTGQSSTYNVLNRGDATWKEYTGVKQTDEDKKKYDTIYKVFQGME